MRKVVRSKLTGLYIHPEIVLALLKSVLTAEQFAQELRDFPGTVETAGPSPVKPDKTLRRRRHEDLQEPRANYCSRCSD